MQFFQPLSLSSNTSQFDHLRAMVPVMERQPISPRGSTWRSHRVLLVTTVTFGLFCDSFLYGMIIPILPSILEDRLSIPHQEVRWYCSALFSVFAGCSLLCTPLVAAFGDRYAFRKTPFWMSLVLMIGVSNP
jgi:MFS family permease